MEKKVVTTFGRFNPPTTGHKKLIDKVHEHAKKDGADAVIGVSHSHDAKKNPLSPEEKEHHLKKLFPKSHFQMSNKEHPSIVDHLARLHKKGYTHVKLVVGSDRHQAMHELAHKYNGTHEGARYHFKHLEVVSAGHRDPDSEGTEGVSASKQREHAHSGNFKEFSKGVPVKKHAKELYHAVRKAMKLENVMTNFKALFLVGGPGSGKDFLIHSVLDECNLKEVSLEKLFAAIVEQQNIQELEDFPSVIINGNADSMEKIIVAKAILESMGYDTAMIYVHTSEEVSKSRNDLRIARGSKTFNESVRKRKYDESVSNLHEYADMFNSFVLYDNSNNFSTVSEEMRKEITDWLLELSTTIAGFLSKEPTNESALDWIAEKVALDLKLRDAKSADKYNGGATSANINSPTRTTVEEKKPKKTKQALPPSVIGDVRNMAIGSQGISGLSVGIVEKKEKKKFKKFQLTPQSTAYGKVANFGNPEAGVGLTAYTVAEDKQND